MTALTSEASGEPTARRGRPRRRFAGLRSPWTLLWLPAVLIILVIYVVPLVMLLTRSFTDPTLGFEQYERLISNPAYLATLLRTLVSAGIAALLTLVLGYPVAYGIATGKPWLRTLLIFAVITPYLTSTLIKTYAWQVILGRSGPVNAVLEAIGIGQQSLIFNSFAVVVSLTHYNLPLMILPLASVMARIDRSQLRAARSLGAGPATAFVRAYIPQTMPGIQVGLILTFVYGVGAFVYPALLGGQQGTMIGVLVRTAINTNADYGLAAAAAVLLAIAVLGTFALFSVVKKEKITSMVSPALRGAQGDPNTASTRSRGLVTTLLAPAAALLDRSGVSRLRWPMQVTAVTMAAFVLLPQLLAIPASFSSERTLAVPPPGWSTRWYENFFTPKWMDALAISLQIALVVGVVATVVGTLGAIGVVRGLRPRARAAASGFMILPLLFPAVVAAAAFYVVFIRFGLVDSATGIALAHVTLALPFVFSIVYAGLLTLDPAYERAAASLGAGLAVTIRRVTLPLLKTSIITGAFFAVLNSFDESTVSVFLSGLRVSTLPKVMYESLSVEIDPTVGVVATLFILLIGAGAIAYTVVRRKRGRTPAAPPPL